MRSRRRGIADVLVLPLLLRPFRCRICSARHFGFYFRKRRAGGGEAA